MKKKRFTIARKIMRGSFFKILLCAFFICISMCNASAQDAYPKLHPLEQRHHNHVLQGGWYSWYPYQYKNNNFLTGLDIALIRTILDKAGYHISYREIDWDKHQKNLEQGKLDIAAGAFYSKKRAKYNYYSEPYRYETNVLYIRRGEQSKFKFNNTDTLIEFIKNHKIKFGIVKGYLYASDKLNKLINNPKYHDRFVMAANETDNFNNLFAKKTSGFFVDRLTAASIAWKNKWQNRVAVLPHFKVKDAVFVLFSKKTTSKKMVTQFNNALKQLHESGQYKNIVMDYIYPILLATTIDRPWFLSIDVLGTIAFALSGIILARREKYSIIGAAVLATLPAAGGGIVRDLILGRSPIGFLSNTTYLITIGLTVIISYVCIRLYPILKKLILTINKLSIKKSARDSSEYAVSIFDSLGLSAFTVIGVVIAVNADVHPLILWGPLFAIITSIGGGVLRDVLRNETNIKFLKGEMYAELSALWGFLLCLYLDQNIYNLNPDAVFIAIIITLLGGFISRLIVIHYKLKTPRF
jgi:polar amino acid transport system substrate-binding protein